MFAWLFNTTETVAATTTAFNTYLTTLPLFTKGLLTTVFGLVGVFLVLLLFFFAIKLMQRMGEKQENAKE